MNQQVYMEFINQVRTSIENYKKNVINQKYTNDLEELQSLKEDLNRQTQDFFRQNQRNITPEVMSRIDSEARESIDYVNLIASETERFIKLDSSLSRIDADVLLAQNNFIKNLSLCDEIQVRMNYYEKASLKKRTQSSPTNVYDAYLTPQAQFVTLENAEGRKKNILSEYAEEYRKLSEMKKNLNKVLQSDRKKMQSIYNQQVQSSLAQQLGEIKTPSIPPELRFLSNEEIKRQAQKLLQDVCALDRLPGMKTKFQFTFEGREFTVLVPLGRKPYFEKSLRDLACYRDILRERQHLEQKSMELQTTSSQLKDEYVDIKIDYDLLKNQTVQQKVSYLQTIMLRIENISSTHQIEVKDLKGNTKSIPAYYYKVYQECKKVIWNISLTIDDAYVASLSDSEKIKFFERLMERIESIEQAPYVVIDGKNISAEYASNYLEARRNLNRLKMGPSITQNATMAIGEDASLREYLIDESYVSMLSDELKLSYYSNLIGKASTCPMVPRVNVEVFGKTLSIPVSLENTVRECERNVKFYMEKNELIINEMEVSARIPEMQFAYYGRLIEKMRRSKKGPKVKVEAFGESFEIPYECLNTFHECLKRMEELKKGFAVKDPLEQNSAVVEQPKHKVEKIRKPRTNKVKEFFKKMSNRIKVALVIGTTMVSTVIAGMFVGSHLKPATSQAAVEKESSFSQSISPVAESVSIDEQSLDELIDPVIGIHQESLNDARMNEYLAAANQSIASQFGSTFHSKNGNVYTSMTDQEPKKLNGMFQGDVFTSTRISLNVPGKGIISVHYKMPNAQAYVDELIAQGATVVRVAGVAQNAEQNYKQNGIETGAFNISDLDMIDYANQSTTNLSQEILAQLNQSKGMGR